jgi:hypothetical protein
MGDNIQKCQTWVFITPGTAHKISPMCCSPENPLIEPAIVPSQLWPTFTPMMLAFQQTPLPPMELLPTPPMIPHNEFHGPRDQADQNFHQAHCTRVPRYRVSPQILLKIRVIIVDTGIDNRNDNILCSG